MMIGDELLAYKIDNKLADYTMKGLIAAWVWFSPAMPVLLGLIALCFIDFFTGVMKSNKLGIKFSSTRARLSVNKLAVYLFIIIATYIFQVIFASPIGLNVYKFLMFFFSSIELVSIYENGSVILGIDVVKALKVALTKGNINKTDFKRIADGLDTKTDLPMSENITENKTKKRGRKKKE